MANPLPGCRRADVPIRKNELIAAIGRGAVQESKRHRPSIDSAMLVSIDHVEVTISTVKLKDLANLQSILTLGW